MSFWQGAWFVILLVLVGGYTIMGGFDLGAGIWQLYARSDEERRAVLRAIAPYWSGNDVWLLAAGGAAFAAFPPVYAALLSGLYPAVILLLLCLILRVVAISFAERADSPGSLRRWNAAFGVTSLLGVILLGVVIGNVLGGMPLDERGNFVGNFGGLLNPFALVVGLLGLAMIATHGALYLRLRGGSDLERSTKAFAHRAWSFYLPLTIVVFALAASHPQLLANYLQTPALWAIPAATILIIALTGLANAWDWSKAAFLGSALAVLGIFASAATALFPNLLPASNNTAWSLTITSTSSSPTALEAMFVAAIIGMPIVIGYTIWIHGVFAGGSKEVKQGY